MNSINEIQLKKRIEEDDRIAQYLRGEMSIQEELAFIDELKRNDTMRERAIIQARMIKGMKQIDEEIADLLDEEAKTNSKIITINTMAKRWLAVAASIVLVVLICLKSYDYYDTINLGKEYANTFPISSIIRGEANADVEIELATLFNNITECKDLENTTSRLAILWEHSKQETYNDYTDYAPYIGWNLAIGYLEKYEKSKAKKVLIEMKQTYPSETVVGSKVILLLGSL